MNDLEKFRSKSQKLKDTTRNSSISSILKNPNSIKFKHHRSVRFEEPDLCLSSNASFEARSSSKVNSKGSQKEGVSRSEDFSVRSQIKKYSSGEDKIRGGKESGVVETSMPIKIVSVRKAFVNNREKSPGVNTRTLNYKFRDQSFYQKLSKFMSYKESHVDINEEAVSKVDSENSSRINNSVEIQPTISTPNENKVKFKKNGKSGLPTGKNQVKNYCPTKSSKSQGQNLLN